MMIHAVNVCSTDIPSIPIFMNRRKLWYAQIIWRSYGAFRDMSDASHNYNRTTLFYNNL